MPSLMETRLLKLWGRGHSLTNNPKYTLAAEKAPPAGLFARCASTLRWGGTATAELLDRDGAALGCYPVAAATIRPR